MHLNLTRYNRSAVDGISISGPDLIKVIAKIKNMGDEGRRKNPCIGPLKSDLTISGCAIIEALMTYWPISEITVADRGIREGILLDMMHHERKHKSNNYKHRGRRFYHRGKKYGKKKSGGN